MLFVKFKSGLPVEVSDKNPGGETGDGPKKWDATMQDGWSSRWDWKSFDVVAKIATYVTAMTGETYLPTDASASTSPRYDICRAPKVGDLVSRAFNGDAYPEGTIEKITKTWQVTTSTGQKFLRYKNTAGWKMAGRGCWMVGGHIDERNPHF